MRADSPRPESPIRLVVVTFDCRKNEEKAFVDYMSNPQVYDSGHKISLFYRRNQNEPDAVENKILDSSYLTEDKNDAVWDVVNDLLPNIPHFYYYRYQEN